MDKKAVVLLSGGLDSALAAKLVLKQGIELIGINFVMAFNEGSQKQAQNAAKELGIKVTCKNITQEFIGIMKNPKHGFGSGANPCIDCKIFFLKKAKEFMKKIGASFVITGEVIGQRPMSQRKEIILLIEKRAGLEGLVLRPLSAKLFEPTIPEENGIVDREKLLAISGRSRKPQMGLAKQFGIKEFSWPAGGCLLTDPAFSKRVKDLLDHNSFTLDNISLLKVGRHFRLSKDSKLVVGRNEKENEAIVALSKNKDLLIEAKDLPGPSGLLRGEATADNLALALRIVARYVDKRSSNQNSQSPSGEASHSGQFPWRPRETVPQRKVNCVATEDYGCQAVLMEYWEGGSETKSFIEVNPLDEKELERIRI